MHGSGVSYIKLNQVKSELQNRRISNIECRMSKAGIARAAQAIAPRVAGSFPKKIGYIPSIFEIHYSIFVIRCFRVSFPMNLAVFWASGWLLSSMQVY
jgi:hypothetical protein